jgi:hypothetical protein
MLAFSRGLRRAIPDTRWAPRLVAAFAVGVIGAGIFVTEPVTNSSTHEPKSHGGLQRLAGAPA